MSDKQAITQERIELYTKAAKQGEAEAMNTLGYMYQQGQDVQQDYTKAATYYEQAIAKGHTTAMTNRAFMHQNGQAGSVNYKEAIKLYDAAIAQGHAIAMSNRAFMYQHGQGTGADFTQGKPDLEKALEFYTKSADLEYPPAMTAKADLLQQKLEETAS